MVARAASAMVNRVLVFMCRDVCGYYFTNFALLSLRGFSMRIFGFRSRSILYGGFRICLNVFPYVQMLWQVVTVRGFLVNFDF